MSRLDPIERRRYYAPEWYAAYKRRHALAAPPEPKKNGQAAHRGLYTRHTAALRKERPFLPEGRVEVVMCPGAACCSWQDGAQDLGLIVRGMTEAESRDGGTPILPDSYTTPIHLIQLSVFVSREFFPAEVQEPLRLVCRHMAPKSLWYGEED